MQIRGWCIKLYYKFKEVITNGTRTTTGTTLSPEKKETNTSQKSINSDNVRRMLATLTPREEKVLRMLGIGEKSDKTLEDVAKELQLSAERVLEIKTKALRKLCHPVRSNKLKSFIDNDSDTIKR